jgi:hypothetical protein
MIDAFYKKNYLFYGLIGSFLVHLFLFFASGVQNRRRFHEDFVIQLPQKKQHERIYFASVVLPQRKEEAPIKKEKKKSVVSSTKKSTLITDKKKTPIKKEAEKTKKKEQKKEVASVPVVEKKEAPVKKKESKAVPKVEPKKNELKKEVKAVPENKASEVVKQNEQQKKEMVSKKKGDTLVAKLQDQVATDSHVHQQKRDPAQQRKRELFFALAQAIKKEVALHWVPPITDRKGLQARVQCTVSPKGKIEQVSLVASSTVIAYDMSVVRAAWKITTEKPLWGTQFLIAFNQ